jgi:hypothetical protein
MKLTLLTTRVLAAVGALTVIALLMSTVAPQTLQSVRVFIAGPVEVRGIPTPDQLVRIEQGQQYIVPPGMALIITGAASKEPGWPSCLCYNILVDGNVFLSAGGSHDKTSVVYFWGHRVDAGSLVEITAAADGPYIISGYLQKV